MVGQLTHMHHQAGRTLEQMDLFFKAYQHWNIRKVAHVKLAEPEHQESGTEKALPLGSDHCVEKV